MQFDSPIRRQAFSLPQLIREQYSDLEPKARKLLSTPEIFSIQKIILTGCGDSYAAALAVKHAFEWTTQIPTEVVDAIDLARYYHAKQIGFAPNSPLVVAISNSGEVARMLEAVQFVNRHGAFTIGVTGNADSPLGQAVQRVYKLDIPAFESAPGVRSYMVCTMALLLLAIRIGEVRGLYTMDQAMRYRLDMNKQANILEKILPDMDASVAATAEVWQRFPAFDFVGSGFDYATAFYGCAKVFEATGQYAMHTNYEEWMHLNIFLRDVSHTGTVLIVNTKNPAISRAKEMLAAAEQLGRPLMIVSDGGIQDFHAKAAYIKVPSSDFPMNMPLTQFIPTALLAADMAVLLKAEYGRGCRGPWKICDGGMGVRTSEILVRETM